MRPAAIAIAASAIFAVHGCATAAVEEPVFSLVQTNEQFEIRRYEPIIVAETSYRGDAVDARFKAFQPLADYIFAKGRKGEEIAMTAPVSQAREKIAMTAPVTQESAGDVWTIGFTMPASYTMETLPAPADPAVTLVEKPAREMAVIKFSGFAGADRMEAKRKELMDWVQRSGLTPAGEATFAFYDPPWTLPFMRRNEVMVEVTRAGSGAG